MAHQVALTVIAPVKATEIESVRRTLEAMGRDSAGNDLIPFGRLAMVHFARLVLIEPAAALDGAPLAPKLILLLDADAPLEQRLTELVDLAGAGLDQVFQSCEGYPAAAERDRARRLAFLRAHQARADAVYVNTIGRTVEQIRQEDALRAAIEAFLDQPGQEWSGRGALEVRAAIQRFVASRPDLAWARSRAVQPGLVWRLGELLHLVGGLALLLLLAVPALIAAPAYLVLLRWHERRDGAPRLTVADAHIQRLAALEDHLAQNQFSALGFLKPSRFRRLTAIGILGLANFATRHFFNRANLAGVKTIHFARWVFIDDRRRLIFASNYDGSLENYMGDFIDKVAWGLNATFSNGVDYPRTTWLVHDGASDEGAFKAFIRARQIPTQVWYTAYGHLTALNIENNAQIRAGLSGPMDDLQAAAWLRRF